MTPPCCLSQGRYRSGRAVPPSAHEPPRVRRGVPTIIPPPFSPRRCRMILLSSCVYLVNYVGVIFWVHSPLEVVVPLPLSRLSALLPHLPLTSPPISPSIAPPTAPPISPPTSPPTSPLPSLPLPPLLPSPTPVSPPIAPTRMRASRPPSSSPTRTTRRSSSSSRAPSASPACSTSVAPLWATPTPRRRAISTATRSASSAGAHRLRPHPWCPSIHGATPSAHSPSLTNRPSDLGTRNSERCPRARLLCVLGACGSSVAASLADVFVVFVENLVTRIDPSAWYATSHT